jgi:hypothetical protein
MTHGQKNIKLHRITKEEIIKTNPINNKNIQSNKKSYNNRSTIQGNNIPINKIKQIIRNKIYTPKKINLKETKNHSNKTNRHKHNFKIKTCIIGTTNHTGNI